MIRPLEIFIRKFGLSAILLSLTAALCVYGPVAHGDEDPAVTIDGAVTSLLDTFSENREKLDGNTRALFDLVDEVASPMFDFGYISKLVLGKNWKSAGEQQRQDFAKEFKRLLIITYATALFQYTGNEAMAFGRTKIKEKKGVKFATVNTEVTLSRGAPVAVVYSMILEAGGAWKIYNLTVGDLNMVLNYRNVIQSAIHSEGLDGMIAAMKANNDKNYN